MRLGVNVVRLTRPFTGVGRFIECLLAEWSTMSLPFERITLYAPLPLEAHRLAFPLDRFELRVGGPHGPDPFWEARFLRSKASEIDVLFSPSYTLPLGYPGRCAVMNLGPAENRPLSYEWWRSRVYERLYRWSARRADVVFACSKSVKRRLVEDYGIPQSRVSVAYLAASRLFVPVRDETELDQARRRYAGGEFPFTLFVGKLARRHSIGNLIQAFARVRNKPKQHRLVIVGPDYLGLNVPALARSAGVSESVVHHPFIEHRELPVLYSAAEETVFPVTDAEGFGLPVIESMACGTPVVSVARGSVPEFAKGAALLVESSSVEHLASGLEQLIGNAALRQELAESGLERARSITWSITAERIASALSRIGGETGRTWEGARAG
jgi:glycosyltransferase involved in cell wall biosynthesis